MKSNEIVAERIKHIISDHLYVDFGEVTETASFIDYLGADSLDTVDLVMAFEEEFGIKIQNDVAESVTTVGDAIAAITRIVS